MTILDKAKELVLGARNDAYGHPRDDFKCQATMFTAYLQKKGLLAADKSLDTTDVAMLMVLVKVARLAQGYGEDHLVDIAGYAAAAEMAAEDGPLAQLRGAAGDFCEYCKLVFDSGVDHNGICSVAQVDVHTWHCSKCHVSSNQPFGTAL